MKALDWALILVMSIALADSADAGRRRRTPPVVEVTQQVVTLPGLVEPHTPGSGAPEEFPTSPQLSALLGPDVDLNRVSYVRTRIVPKDEPSPRAILILIPGFLGGATTFDPLARQLVEELRGLLEVWAVDRRPNQLEDRLGGAHALAGAEVGDFDAIVEGAQFYFADTDLAPTGDFPGPGDLDVNLDGFLDPQLPLTDGFGATRGPLLFAQDEVRFMAHWGIDTYMRDWKILVDRARQVVGPAGAVLLGGHSQGTTWSTTFAAYDFDPSSGVDAGYTHIDGLVLIEGGGVGPGSATKPTLAEYLQTVSDLETAGGPDVFLNDFFGIPLRDLGSSGEVAAIAGVFQPTAASLIQRTPVFGTGITGALLSTPATNRAVAGLFLDDDFSPIGAFRASFGFTDNGPNVFLSLPGIPPFYLTQPATVGGLRTWKNFDDPTLPSCPPNVVDVSPGCAILDNGPPSAPTDPPRVNGVEAEVSDVDEFLRTQFGDINGFEWYFVSGRVNLDFSYGNDSSSLGDESLLAVTQNANVDVPVIAIGGSNGLTPEAKSFDRYLGSIATPVEDQQVLILEGYAHVDPVAAADNAALPVLADWIDERVPSPPAQ